MPLAVRIPADITARIQGVTPTITSDVRRALEKLAEFPKLGTPDPTGSYRGCLAYKFRVDRPPVTREFMLLYEVTENDALDVVDFGVMDHTSHRLRMPEFRKEPLPELVPVRPTRE